MEPILAEATVECGDTYVKEAIELKDSENFIMDDEKSETFIKTETFDDNVVEIKPVGHQHLVATSSYVIQKNPKVDNKKQQNVKTRQAAAVKSVVDRPKTAREKTKISVNSAEWKPHTPGQLPAYLRKQKENLLKKSSTFQSDVTSAKNSATNVGGNKIHTKKAEQGDMVKSSTSVPSVDGDHSQEIEKMKAQHSAKLMSMRTEKLDLELRNKSLEKQLNDVTTARDKSDKELKSSLDKIRSLENKVGSNLIEIRSKDERLEKFEIEIANLIKYKQDMAVQMKNRIEDNQKLEKKMEKLTNELHEKSSSFKTLMTEKNQLEAMLHEKSTSFEALMTEKGQLEAMLEEKCPDDDDDELNVQSAENIEALLHENEVLKNELNGKINDVESLKQDKFNLIGEIKHLKTQTSKLTVDSSAQALSFEIADLEEKINSMTRNEKELNQKILMLHSKLDDERNTNIRNNTLLEYRAEYIKTLQDVDNVNKCRLVLHVKDLDDCRKQIQEFEKFKAAHKEEKGNFKKILKTLETENTRLKTKVEIYEKNKFNFK